MKSCDNGRSRQRAEGLSDVCGVNAFPTAVPKFKSEITPDRKTTGVISRRLEKL